MRGGLPWTDRVMDSCTWVRPQRIPLGRAANEHTSRMNFGGKGRRAIWVGQFGPPSYLPNIRFLAKDLRCAKSERNQNPSAVFLGNIGYDDGQAERLRGWTGGLFRQFHIFLATLLYTGPQRPLRSFIHL